MREQTIICTVCPVGCSIRVSGDGAQVATVSGNQCKRGEAHARNEYSHPLRLLTSTVKVEGGSTPLVAVRSSRPVPKEKLLACMDLIKAARVAAPVGRHQAILANILDTGADIIATATVNQE